MRRLIQPFVIILGVTLAGFSLPACQSQNRSGDKKAVEVQSVAVEVNGTKFWIPSHITVNKGDTVKLHLVSKVPAPNTVHGFAIEAFKIAEVVDGKGKDIEFVADKEGIFPIKCHLHPAHIGGQLVVLED